LLLIPAGASNRGRYLGDNGRKRDVMAERPVLERLTASDLCLWQRNDSSWSSDIGWLAILGGTRQALVSATSSGDVEQRLLQQSLGAAAVGGGR
jgi:hypothetical protein